VDRAALDAALSLGVPCGGWSPAGRRAEDGPIADLYPLSETARRNYAARTRANVRDSDATLILGQFEFPGKIGAMSPGTRLTVEAARKLGRPLFVAQLVVGDAAAKAEVVTDIVDWIGEHRISALNVAGPRESECPGIYAAAHGLILNLLTAVPGR